MANPDAAAILRADINTVLLEAMAADQLFIGQRVFPVYESGAKDGQFPKFRLGKGELLNDDATVRTPTGAYGRVYRTYENDNFACLDRGLEELVDDSYKADVARFFDAEIVAGKQVLTQMMLSLEVRIAAEVMSATNFTATAAAVAYTEANIATINFVKDVLDAKGRLEDKGVIANSIVVSRAVWDRVRRSTLLQNYVRGNRPTDSTLLLRPDDVAGVFDLQQLLVGRAPKNAAKKGQAYSSTPIWGNTYVWVGNIASGDFMNGGAGRTIVWNRDSEIFTTETYRDERRRSDVVRVRHHTDEKVVDTTAGELITTSYA